MSDAAPAYPQTLYQPEDGATQILLIRHGQSAPFMPGQPFDLVDGHGDPHLTELGHHQAELLAGRLEGEPISSIYVSTLTRTAQTAAPLASALGLTPVVDADLREVYLGQFEGGRFRQMAAEDHPAVAEMRDREEWGAIPEAETNAQLTTRTVGAIQRVVANHPDQMVAVVCHGGVIAAILGHALGVNPFRLNGARHTSISHLVVNPSSWVVRSFNDGAHAGQLTVDHAVPSG